MIWKSIQNTFKRDRDTEKELAVNKVIRNLKGSPEEFTETEITEILNRVVLRIFEDKKQRRTQLIKEAREVQQSMLELKI